MIQIRPATKTDAALIAGISRETFYETFVAHNTEADMDKFLSDQFSCEQLMAEVGESGNYFLLAYTNDQPAGYVFLKNGAEKDRSNKNVIEISRIYVRNSFIGKGIGKALLEAAITHAKKESKKQVWLGVWEHNHRAIRFYTSFGFKKSGQHDFLLGDDVQVDWIMELLIIRQ